MVGLINTIFGYSIYGLAILFGLHYSFALLIATILGVLFNFKTIKVMVFKSQKKNIFLRFVLVYAIVYLINLLGIRILLQSGSNSYISAMFVLPLSTAISYLLNKNFVFNNEKTN
jgi:putative flippase GtrA